MAEKRDYLELLDFTTDELYDLLGLAARIKRGGYSGQPLAGKSLAMIFQKSSTRTRVSFETGTFQLGGQALFLSSRDIQLGRGELLKDTARVLSRYVDGILIRTFEQENVQELAYYADVPVINGLTDLVHPCQVLADLLTIQENFDEDLTGRKVAWIGDGNNMANSWLNAARRCGLELHLACPPGYEPDRDMFDSARSSANVHLTHDPDEAVAGADVVTTDVWASMGQEEEAKQRARVFHSYRVDEQRLAKAADGAIFLHCLPAHRGEEVTEDVIEGAQSRVFDEVENRLHVQKALLIRLMGS